MQRILFFGLFLFSLVVSGHAWSGVTASPNPSSTGNFTISWTGAEDESVVTETVGGSSEVVNITSGSQYSVSGKATGSYTYSVVTQMSPHRCAYYCLPENLGSVTVTVTAPPPPSIPGSLSVPSIASNGSYTVSWAASSGSVSAYHLQERANGGSWNTVQTSTSRSKSFSKGDNKYYDYRVKACGASCSNYSASKRVTVPAASISLSASNIQYNTSAFTLTWSSVMTSSCSWSAGSLSGTSGSKSFVVSGWTDIGYSNIWIKNTTMTCNKFGGGTISKTLTLDSSGLPPKPTVSVSWNKSNSYVGQSATLNWSSTLASSCTLDGGSVSFSGSRSYSFSNTSSVNKTVTCTNSGGSTSASDSISVAYTTPGVPGAISAPSTASTGSYTVSWSASSGTLTAYQLQERANGGSWSTIQTSTSRSRSFSKNANKYYDYRIRACNNNACSGYNASKRVTIPAASITVSASPSPIQFTDDSFTLTWSSVMTSSCSWSSGSISGKSGNKSFTLSGWTPTGVDSIQQKNTTLTCNVIGGGTVSKSLTVYAESLPPKPTVNVTWNKNSAFVGQSATLTWATSDATSCSLDSASASLNSSKNYTFTTDGTVTKTVTCTNAQGSTSASDSITVAYTTPGVPGTTSAPSTASTGSYTVSWSASSGTLTAYQLQESANGGSWSTIQTSTSRSRSFSKNASKYYDYRIRACNNNACSGYNTSKRVTIPAASITVSASPSPLNFTSNVFTLTWNSTMTTGCSWSAGSISGSEGSKVLSVTGWTPVGIDDLQRKMTTLTCNVIGGGTVTEDVELTALAVLPLPSIDIQWVDIGESITLTWTSTYAENCFIGADAVAINGSETFVFNAINLSEKTLTCSNEAGEVSATAPIPKPLVSVAWDKTSVAIGGSATLTWSSIGADACEYHSVTAVSASQLVTLNFAGDISHNVTCSNASGKTEAAATISVYRPSFQSLENDPENDAQSGNVYYGKTPGEHSIDKSGAFNYSVPIDVSPGINGMQPDISLGYSSTAQNGLMGWGWNISGLSAISRCPASVARDGYPSGISDGENYKYCLDGQRLVQLANGEYRTESETFKRITKNSDSWLVENPDGSQVSYGENDGVTHAKSLDYADGTISWLMDKKSDVSGNYMTYIYEREEDNGHVAIKEIQYTQNDNAQDTYNTLKFYYEERDDVSTRYSAKTLFTVDQRLSRVEAKAGGMLVYVYNIDYENVDGVERADPLKTSRVKSVSKCFASSSSCAEPIVFEWSSTHRDNYILDDADQEYVLDEDIAEDRYIEIPEVFEGPTDELTGGMLIQSGFPVSTGGRRPLNFGGVRGDFDGDNKLEVIWIQGSATEGESGTARKVAMSAGDPGVAFTYTDVYESVVRTFEGKYDGKESPNDSYNVLNGAVADFNGDGLDDYYIKRNTSIDVFLSNGITLIYSDGYSMTKADLGIFNAKTCCQLGQRVTKDWLYNYVIKDINGDNLVDILRMPLWDVVDVLATISDFGVDDISVAINNGDGFDEFERWATSTDFSFLDTQVSDSYLSLADVNGDSLVDLVGLDGQVGINTGLTFVFDASWSENINLPVLPYNMHIFVSVDSLPGDIAGGLASGNAGGGLVVPGYAEGPPGVSIVRSSFSPFASVTRVADVNGDGLVDIVAVRWDGIYVSLSNGREFLSAVMWSDALTYHDLVPFCNMMECNTRRRTFELQDANRDGMADVLYTRAWNITGKKDASDVMAIYSKGRVDSEGEGFTAPVMMASIAPLPDGAPQDSNAERLGKPYVTEEGDLVIHRQPSFFHAEMLVFIGIPLIETVDVAVKIGINQHQILGVHESNTRRLSVEYKKLSDSKVYIQTGVTKDDSKISSRYPTTYSYYDSDGQASVMPDHTLHSAARGLQVVSTLSVYDGANLSTQDGYFYKNRRTHRLGLGSLGFEQVQKTTTLAGQTQKVRTVSDYLQEVGQESSYLLVAPSKATQCVITNANTTGCETATGTTLLSEHKQNWKVRVYDDGSSPRFHSYALEEETKNYDLTTGTLVNTISKRLYNDSVRTSCPVQSDITSENRTTITNDHFDAYGTPLDSIENRCDTFGVTGTYTDNDNISNDTVNWCLHQTQDPKVHTWVYDEENGIQRNSTRHTRYSYNSSGAGVCRVGTETREPSAGNELWLQKTFSYNGYGTQSSITETVNDFPNDGIGFTSRTYLLNESFSDQGERTVISTNALGHAHTEIFGAEFGSLKRAIDANDLIFDYFYDVLGRVTYTENLGVVTIYDYRSCDNCFAYNADAAWYSQSKTEGQSATRSYFDGLGREVGSRWRGLTGNLYYIGQKYNSLGLPEYMTEPFGGSDTPSDLATRTYFDVLGRITQTDFPTGVSQTVNYTVVDGAATVITTDTADHSTEQRFDALGREKTITDALNIRVSYWHDAQGNVSDIQVAETDDSNKINHQIIFDLLGRKTRLNDPDIGFIDYTYNAFGHLAEQENSEGERICYFYDEQDRQINRFDNASSSCTGGVQHQWVYDEFANGLLSRVLGRDTKNRVQNTAYSYTPDYLLPETASQLINGETFTVTNYYDQFNRPVGFAYPTGFTLEQRYNSYGHPHQSVNVLDGEVLWQANDDDARGNLTDFGFGNGASVLSVFRPETGLIESRLATLNSTILQDHLYTFDDEGNLRTRQDRRALVTQNFCYDALYRLTDQVIGSSCSDVFGRSYDGSAYHYDIHGNLTQKDEITDYDYTGSGGPHAVSFAKGNNYTYDNAGRMVTGFGGRVIDYSAFGKPTYMGFENGYQTEVTYGALQTRVQRGDVENGELTSTVYVDKHYERITTPDGKVEHRHYMAGWGVHVTTEDNAITEDYNVYFTKDHIGSMASKSDDRLAQTVKFHANEPWGRRQDQDWSGVTYDTLSGTELEEMTFGTTRGFTDHEHLDGVGLIHMNGRVYDPVVGRFVSPDPWIQDPENSQSFNRYSYVINNPLRYTDPTGEMFEVDLSADMIKQMSDLTDMERTVISTGIDFVPLAGDAKGIGEAIADPTLVNVTAAVVGIIPGVGDLAAKAIKNTDKIGDIVDSAKNLFKNSDSSKKVDSLNGSAKPDSSGNTPDTGVTPDSGSAAKKTLAERGEELAQRNGNKNSVTIKQADGHTRVDLRGKPHSSKELGNESVPTPHAQKYKNNIIPEGPRKGQIGNVSKDGDVIPGDSDMLRMVDSFLKSKGQ